MRRFAINLTAIAVMTVAVGCGAKTGLLIEGVDFDGGVDLGPPRLVEPSCVPLPYDPDAGVRNVDVAVVPRVSAGDVAFLVDTTGSMGGVIEALKRNILTALVPGLQRALFDVRFSVSSFDDFPVDPYGGAPTDVAYRTTLSMTYDTAQVATAVDSLVAEGGGDGDESHVEALYQLATGEGIIGFQEWVPAAACPDGTFGATCFRDGVLPLVFLFIDTPSHNGPGGLPYDPRLLGVAPASYAETLEALRARGMKVATFWAGGAESVYAPTRLARGSGSVDSAGAPLVFPIDSSGSDLVAQVLEAVDTMATGFVSTSTSLCPIRRSTTSTPSRS